jgi:hypothetical protein
MAAAVRHRYPRVPAKSRFVWFVPPAALARSQVADSSACGVARATGDQLEHFGPLPRPWAAEAASTAETADTTGRTTRNGDTRPAETADVQEQTASAPPPARRHVRPLTAAADTGEAVRLLVGRQEPFLRRLTASAAAGPGPAETGDRLWRGGAVQRVVHRDLRGAARQVVVLGPRCTSARS